MGAKESKSSKGFNNIFSKGSTSVIIICAVLIVARSKNNKNQIFDSFTPIQFD
jgi:hypothetical protein